MIIAVDFDGTLCSEAYPNIGKKNVKLFNALIYLREKGHKLILWTCRNGQLLRQAENWCSNNGLYFDAVNENLPEVLKIYTGVDSRKISYDILIDDKNINIKDLNSLSTKRIKEYILNKNQYSVMIPLRGLLSDNGQQYLSYKDGKYFACSYRDSLKQEFTQSELNDIPEAFKPFIPRFLGDDKI
ncbi:hypothetical protein [Liquorilactobacillus hordei]|uniref:Hydrolase n=1 Tax=Liquorilactobacillus hordei DSM 19519 TaxID=1423759 RepID=A0A0R1MJ69_9LACO|nr:hypothetical protein [Liquorilactobacillus hordei]KRL07958.1 hypothetical protein FC92_GL001026 [Liquorilactobacillus hordei DSM 19519]